jgi:phenylacetic acid degradation operon negative regulatory protein
MAATGTNANGTRVSSQQLLVTLLGRHVVPRDLAVFSGTYIDVLERLGVSEYAVRSTLTRMVQRGLLTRHRRGRRTYFGPTATLRGMLLAGEVRIFHTDPVQHDWDGTWTLLSFSIPEPRRSDRHRLRARLSWQGFGLLRDGLWIAPGQVDAEEVIEGLELTDHVEAFHARAVAPTDPALVLADAWDLDRMAAAYHAFLTRWDVAEPMPEARDHLARQVCLITEWRLLIREAAPLPAEALPGDWPAQQAADVFRRLERGFSRAADRLFEGQLDALEVATAG